MAEYTLIDRYLAEFDRQVGRIRNAEEIVAEVADHLFEAVAVRTRHGTDQMAAQRQALEEFGDPGLVGAAFVSAEESGGIAVPTQFTRRAGIALVISAALWATGLALLVVSEVLDNTRPWEGLPLGAYLSGAITWQVAGTLLALGIAGLNRRHGGTLGVFGRVSFWMAIALAIFAIAPWFWFAWSTAMLVVGVILGHALAKADLVPRWAARLIQVGPVVIWTALAAFEVLGARDVEIGGGPTTAFAALGLAAFCVGLVAIGRWMRSETPVDEPADVTYA